MIKNADKPAMPVIASYFDDGTWRCRVSGQSSVVITIRAAVDMLPDTHAAPLDDAAKTVAALVEALRQTWSVMDSAGLINLSTGVQLGQTSWFVKASDARAESVAALRAAGVELP